VEKAVAGAPMNLANDRFGTVRLSRTPKADHAVTNLTGERVEEQGPAELDRKLL